MSTGIFRSFVFFFFFAVVGVVDVVVAAAAAAVVVVVVVVVVLCMFLSFVCWCCHLSLLFVCLCCVCVCGGGRRGGRGREGGGRNCKHSVFVSSISFYTYFPFSSKIDCFVPLKSLPIYINMPNQCSHFHSSIKACSLFRLLKQLPSLIF